MSSRNYPSSLDTGAVYAILVRSLGIDGYSLERVGNKDDMMITIRKRGFTQVLPGMDFSLSLRIRRSQDATSANLVEARWGTLGPQAQRELMDKIWRTLDSVAGFRMRLQQQPGASPPQADSGTRQPSANSSTMKLNEVQNMFTSNLNSSGFCNLDAVARQTGTDLSIVTWMAEKLVESSANKIILTTDKRMLLGREQLKTMLVSKLDGTPSGVGTVPKPRALNFCPKCGSKLVPGDRFCARCGTKLNV